MLGSFDISRTPFDVTAIVFADACFGVNRPSAQASRYFCTKPSNLEPPERRFFSFKQSFVAELIKRMGHSAYRGIRFGFADNAAFVSGLGQLEGAVLNASAVHDKTPALLSPCFKAATVCLTEDGSVFLQVHDQNWGPYKVFDGTNLTYSYDAAGEWPGELPNTARLLLSMQEDGALAANRNVMTVSSAGHLTHT